MQVKLNSFKGHHEHRYCFKCFKKFELPLLTSILFKDIQICPECTQRIQQQKRKSPPELKILKINDIHDKSYYKVMEKLEIFLPHQFRQTTSFCVAGYQGSLLITQLQKFLQSSSNIKLHNIQDLRHHLSCLTESILPKVNITFSNIARLQLKGENIQSIQFLQYFDFRNLNDLSLWDNNIVQLNGLTKCQFPKLTQIHLSHNRIKNISHLTRVDYPKLQKISLGFRQSQSFQEYKDLLRLNSKDVKTIYLNYLPFIQFYDKSLHHKYQNVHIVSLNNCQYSSGRKNL